MSAGLVPGLLAFEWRFQTRRLTFAIAAAFFTVMGFGLASSGFGPPEIQINGPWAVSQSIGLLSLVSVFALTLFTARAVLRDREHRMEEIVFTTSITKGHYLFSHLTGALMAAGGAFAFALIGLVAGAALGGHDAGRLAAFDPLVYLWPFLVLALPSMLFAATVLFAVAVLSRSAIATSVGGVAIYMLYFVGAILTNSPLMASSTPVTPESMSLAALTDPFGLSAFYQQTHYWTTAERNLRPLALEGCFLWNRLLWLAVTGVVLAVVHRLFAFRARGDARVRPRSESSSASAPPAAIRPLPTAPATRGWKATRVALWSTTRLELRATCRGWPFAVLMALLVGTVGIEIVQRFTAAEFGTRLLPTTGLMIGNLREPLGLFGLVVVVYFAAELVWRDRSLRVDEIVDALPASSAVFLTAKAVALAVLVAMMIGAAAVVCSLFQLANGHRQLEPELYASLFYFVGLPLVLFGLLAILLQTLASNRWAGLLSSVLAALVWHRGAAGGPDHPLLRYAAAPQVPYSAMNGFAPDAVSFAWFMAYWSSVAALLSVVAVGVWRRGGDAGLAYRLRALPRRLGLGGRRTASALAASTLVLGALVYYQTDVVNGYESADAVADFKADYERTYRHLESLPQPTVTRVEAEVDLFPEQRRFAIRGAYALENRSGEAIAMVWVAYRRDLGSVKLRLDGRPPTDLDERFATASFRLGERLPPGATAELTFEVEASRRGATARYGPYDIVGNGSFLLSTFSFPSLGYRRSRELDDPAERRRRGLEERSRPTTLEAARAGELERSDLRTVTFDATVSTAADQIAVAPGALVDSWREGSRRYFRYAVDQPMMPHFAFVSARYAVERRRLGDIDVELYHHPGHEANAERFLAAAERALAYGIRHFGPYPYSALRIVEIPAHWDGFAGLALPGIVYMVEDRGFLTDLTDPGRPDIVTKRVAHEVAHQWWGHQLSPAEEPGASALVETLARYTEMRVLEELYGEAALTRLLATERNRYLMGRTRGDEVPLYQVTDQSWLYYSKGAIVMAALTDLVGEGAVNRALASLLRDAADDDDPPDSIDLLDHLAAVTPDEYRELLDEWWRQIVLHRLRIDSADAECLADGRYRVRVTVDAVKSAVVDQREVELAVDEPIDVVLFGAYPATGGAGDRMLASSRPRMRGERTVVEFVVDEAPEYAAVDPFVRRLELNIADNVKKVQVTCDAN